MTVIGDERAENATGITGFGMKLLGGIILATYWTFLFFNSLISSDVPKSMPLDGLFDDLILAMRIHLFVHAAGFSLIVSGWIAENSKRKKIQMKRKKNRKAFDKTRRV
tara:strand:- start:11 stop:334 length:324 start_codon:yes stop_codon:yes gene_type:complete